MAHPNSVPVPQPESSFLLIGRLITGALIGLAVSLPLLSLGRTGYLPILGPIIVGQDDLFSTLFFYLLYDRFHNFDLIYSMSLSFYSGLWAAIGAMLFSGKKRIIVTGIILLVLYILSGITWYIFRLIAVISN